jgi:Abnormal spindle-like microcephaly-assoc'd, ASPM-SPD-2-Hydin
MVRAGAIVRVLVLCGLSLTTLAFAKTNKTIVTYPTFGVSRPVADMPVELSMFPFQAMPEPGRSPNKPIGNGMGEDPALQKDPLGPLNIIQGVDFAGIASNGYAPSDSNMAVGPKDIVEVVNVLFQVFNKTGGTIAGPTNIQNLFSGLAGDCSSSTYGDPVVLYDRAADRWLISMIGSGSTVSECIAVSKTNDPTGAYYLYGYSFGSNLNDYPKLGTWATASNSAYLASYDIFINFSSYGGADLCGLDRTKMLAGNSSAAQLCKMTPSSEFSYLPSDMDGPTPPADGTPGVFINHDNGTSNQLYLRTLALNFASGTATLSAATKITVNSFTDACHSSCVPELSGSALDALGDLQMYRFAVRHFADHDRAVLNNTVLNSGTGAVRWYELYDPAGAVTLNQQGTFAPDSTWRWMASAAEDQNADIAIGYSASSSSIHPGNRVAGRVPTDPSGSLETEVSLIAGAGSQTGLSRWGDYSAMQVDPTDDCTFWYVAQYEQASGSFNWHTNIGSFAFNGCGGGGSPDFSLSANPTSLSVAQGSSGTSTITITPIDGFTGSVNLSATGLPTGVTAGFSPNPATTTSTLTLTVGAGAATGTSTITITGVSGTLTHTTTVSLTVTASGPVVSLTPTSLTWGKVLVGVKSGAKKVTVSNTGASTLTFNSIATTGDFALVPLTSKTACGSTLAAGKSCIVKVTFTPTQKGLRTGSLNFTDNAPGSPQSVSLTGTGK